LQAEPIVVTSADGRVNENLTAPFAAKTAPQSLDVMVTRAIVKRFDILELEINKKYG